MTRGTSINGMVRMETGTGNVMEMPRIQIEAISCVERERMEMDFGSEVEEMVSGNAVVLVMVMGTEVDQATGVHTGILVDVGSFLKASQQQSTSR
jgi:hypothetical protein